MGSDALPRILLDDPTRWLLELRRRFRSATGRELGLAHATRLLARVLPRWQELPLEGPGGFPVYLDLRNKEGYLNGGFRNTVGHMAPLLELARDGDVVLDVGANIGIWSRELLARRRPRRLVAFEPELRNFELLTRNLSPYPDASGERLAIGARDGTVRLSEDLDSGQNYVVTDVRPARRSHEIPMVTLDGWTARAGLERVDLLKVDVEGLELEVFQGGAALLERCRPIVYFEYQPEAGEAGRRKAAAFELLRSLGYEMQAVLLDGRTRRVAAPAECEALAESSHDVIAVHAGAAATRGRR